MHSAPIMTTLFSIAGASLDPIPAQVEQRRQYTYQHPRISKAIRNNHNGEEVGNGVSDLFLRPPWGVTKYTLSIIPAYIQATRGGERTWRREKARGREMREVKEEHVRVQTMPDNWRGLCLCVPSRITSNRRQGQDCCCE